tara:strand:+ start:91 stop:288 length:198 start_codon:yes stop_codon:yes gene_type:complete
VVVGGVVVVLAVVEWSLWKIFLGTFSEGSKKVEICWVVRELGLWLEIMGEMKAKPGEREEKKKPD